VLARQRCAIALCTHAYRMNYLNIIFPLRRPGLSGLADFADFAIIIEYTFIQLSRHCVVPIEFAAQCGCIIPELYPVVTGRNRLFAAPHLDLLF
jgi:hypothetical protein